MIHDHSEVGLVIILPCYDIPAAINLARDVVLIGAGPSPSFLCTEKRARTLVCAFVPRPFMSDT